ncbi:putative dehydrogenase [Brachybacterium muris]|uniref:Gfo/Idh/MocA family protein n=1 Tax=Brachybacterium muris TaxID=219301 RepID=UPI00195CA146|nr:Gfo/Idh/MocA family oxidoreductase [Brachybacterium muris]MBM7502363.1 putative dehydrogenase [Brachybacterium muris]MCT1430698.1 Gfo/Idh/MocA family oxidoreductase [Brachybacterium muris]
MPHPDRVQGLRVGIIGTGGISHEHAPGWIEQGVDLHCYSHSGAEAFAEQYGATVHEALDDLLAAVDVVDVCTPTPSHAGIVHQALDAGCHVVCEKPLTLTVEDSRAVVEHAERAGLHLFPAHVVRYFPQYAAAKQAVDAGAVGTPAVLRYERTGEAPGQDWYADDEASGGIIMDQMIHDLDQAIWITGPVTSVYAQQSVGVGPHTVRTGHVVLTHEGGAISHCRGLWGPPGTAFRYTFDIAGDAGRLQYDSAGDPGVVLDVVASARREEQGGYLPDVSGIRSPYTEEILEFTAAITSGTPTRVSAADGAYAVEVSRAALESLRTGRSIPC